MLISTTVACIKGFLDLVHLRCVSWKKSKWKYPIYTEYWWALHSISKWRIIRSLEGKGQELEEWCRRLTKTITWQNAFSAWKQIPTISLRIRGKSVSKDENIWQKIIGKHETFDIIKGKIVNRKEARYEVNYIDKKGKDRSDWIPVSAITSVTPYS